MERPKKPDSFDAFMKLSKEQKELWLLIDKCERRLVEIEEENRQS